jgi:hypothetical protein
VAVGGKPTHFVILGLGPRIHAVTFTTARGGSIPVHHPQNPSTALAMMFFWISFEPP